MNFLSLKLPKSPTSPAQRSASLLSVPKDSFRRKSIELHLSRENLLDKLFGERKEIVAEVRVETPPPAIVDIYAEFWEHYRQIRLKKERLSCREKWCVAIGLSITFTRVIRALYNAIAEFHRVEQQVNTEPVSRTMNMLDFRLSDFKFGCSVTLNAEQRKILDKEKQNYTDNDREVVLRLCERIKSFSKYAPNLKRKLCECLSYSLFEAGRKIIRQGHKAKYVYYILNGSVQVYKTEKKSRIVLTEMHSGDCFGELAVIKKMERSASVESKVKTEVLWIEDEDYLRILSAITEEENTAKLKFFQQLPIFQGVSAQSLSKLMDLCVKKDTQTNEVLVKESEPLSQVCFIAKGSVRIVRIVPFLKKTVGKDKYVLEPTDCYSTIPGDLQSKFPKTFISSDEKIVYKLLCINVLPANSFFNEECLGPIESGFSPCSLITCEPCEIFRISRSEFIKFAPVFLINAFTLRREIKSAEHSMRAIQNRYIATLRWIRLKKSILK